MLSPLRIVAAPPALVLGFPGFLPRICFDFSFLGLGRTKMMKVKLKQE